jgi:hypothetical protein
LKLSEITSETERERKKQKEGGTVNVVRIQCGEVGCCWFFPKIYIIGYLFSFCGSEIE